MPRPSTAPRTLDERLRAELVALLRGGNAHVPTALALDGIPPARINERAEGLPYSLWELLYHLWFSQKDILDFCRNPAYAHRDWPEAYWPARDGSASDWDDTRAAFLADLDDAVGLAEAGDLTASFAHSEGYTLLRELLLIADHNGHHIGQVIALRRMLGLWEP